MNLIVKNYDFNYKYISRSIKICLCADFHFSHISNRNKYNMVLDNIKENKPDYICIAGDYIDCINMLDDSKLYLESINYIKELCKISKVIFTFGNHDITKINIKNKREYGINEKWIKEISLVKNVIYLNNSMYEENGIRFIGYSAPFNYYKKFNENGKLLIEDFNKVIPNIKDDKYNVLLCHSPIRIFSNKSFNNINDLKNIDIILSGHMHNALTPNFIDKIWKSNRGLVSPHKYLFPNNARGIKTKIIDGKKINLVITGGVTKVHEVAPKPLHFLDKLYNPEVVYINIDKS